jgi:hypothetical protein
VGVISGVSSGVAAGVAVGVTAGVAVGGRKDGVTGDGFFLFLLVGQHPPDQVHIFFVLRVLRNHEPMLPQVFVGQQIFILLRREQNQFTGQKVEQQSTVLDLFLHAVMQKAGAEGRFAEAV